MPLDRQKIILKVGYRIRDYATAQGNIPFVTGDLRKSIQVESAGSGRVRIGSNLSYAKAVHDGRPEITFGPKAGKKALKFKLNGKWVFSKKVTQPARKPQPFITRAIEKVKREGFQFIAKDIVTDLAKDFRKELRDIKIVIG